MRHVPGEHAQQAAFALADPASTEQHQAMPCSELEQTAVRRRPLHSQAAAAEADAEGASQRVELDGLLKAFFEDGKTVHATCHQVDLHVAHHRLGAAQVEACLLLDP